MIQEPLSEVGRAHIELLITNCVPESKTIEYKVVLPGNADAEKREFLADVSSFANSMGGDIVFGVRESAGLPVELVGLEVADMDAEVTRIDSILRSGIEPPLRYAFKHFSLQQDLHLLVLRVERSQIGPHRVIFRGHDKFYQRHSTGKYPLNTQELRESFLRSDTIEERVRRFRAERVAELLANNTPIAFRPGPKFVLHLIPARALESGEDIDIGPVTEHHVHLPPIAAGGWDDRFTFEGYMTYSARGTGSESYVHLYRSGIIEAVAARIARKHDGKVVLPAVGYEKRIINSLSAYIQVLKALNVEVPIVGYLSFLGVRGCSLLLGDEISLHSDHPYPLDRETLELPELLIESLDEAPVTILRPAFDLVWNAFGYERSFNYDDQENWRGSQ